jgi:hypothetical protein
MRRLLLAAAAACVVSAAFADRAYAHCEPNALNHATWPYDGCPRGVYRTPTATYDVPYWWAATYRVFVWRNGAVSDRGGPVYEGRPGYGFWWWGL